MKMRPLFQSEKKIIELFAEKLNESERMQLLSDEQIASATSIGNDGSKVKFELAGYQRPEYRGQHPYGAEGRVLDVDNSEVAVLLFADENGRLLELELIRWDARSIQNPQWASLQIFS